MNSTFREISVIVPTLNEATNVRELLKRLVFTFEKNSFKYQIVFIDDHSTDKTPDVIKRAIKKYSENLKHQLTIGETFEFDESQIIVKTKEGKSGKAFSIYEGLKYVKYENIAIIDADLQYPPEAIIEMVGLLDDADIVVGNRKYKKDLGFRKRISSAFKFISGKLLFDLDHDIQSGLKVFRKEVIENIDFKPSSGWTFDLEFLHKASEMGFRIKNFDIDFARRISGRSKVKLFKTSLEIFLNAINLKLRKVHPKYVEPKNDNSMLGAGIRHKKNFYVTHSTLTHKESAYVTAILSQKVFVISLILLSLVGLILNTLLTLKIVVGVLSTIYFLDTLFNCYLILRSLKDINEIKFSDKELKNLDESSLPVYSILCPLYKEAHMIPQFVEAIGKLSYPQDKLDVLLLLEEDDIESIELVRNTELPFYVRAIVVPHSIPKTKPKACNYGLSMAKGEYLVIYDAEDIPDPLQLKKAFLGFKKTDKNVLCLQAKLNYHNPDHNLLTRFFTAEYSLWFDVLLTGYQALNTTIPLGGTSNHFKTETLKKLKGWDSFNVTEDADLGVRLFKSGYRTAIIDSTTYEEANSNLKNWIRQRSRWIKGYMQTYLVHTRDHMQFLKKDRHHALLFNLILGGKIMFILINPILWLATLSYFTLYQFVGPTIEKLYPPLIFYMAASSLIFGNFLFLFYYMIGIIKREQYQLVKYVFLIPFYWMLISYAGIIALYQLIFKPFYWEKTLHGAALNKNKATGTIFNFSLSNNSIIPNFLKAQNNFVLRKRLFIKIIKSNILDFIFLFQFKPEKSASDNLSILIFNWRDTKHKWAGGAESYIHEISKKWTENGYRVTVFSSNDHFSKRQEVVENINVIRIGGSYTVYIWAFIFYILKLRNNTDIIVDSENGIPFFTPLYAFKPVILLIHHVHQEIFMSELKFPFSYIARFAEGQLMPFIYKGKQIVTVSESSKKAILKFGISKEDKISIIKPGIADSFPEYKKYKKPTFIYLGRLKPYKNIDVAINAFEIVNRMLKKSRLLIVGDGESMDNLKSLVNSKNLNEKIKFYGKVDENLKYELLGKSWVALQPSKMEGWGLTVVEANACGTPVIATNTDGLKDSIVEGKTGILVRHKDTQGFANQMLTLARGKKKRFILSQNAYIWSSNFSWDKSAKEFLEIIKNENYNKSYFIGFKYINSFLNRITSLF